MTGLVLANPTYRRLWTDENAQLEDGLAAAGWKLGGRGHDWIPNRDVPLYLRDFQPDAVLVHDPRAWDVDTRRWHGYRIRLRGTETLRECPDIFRLGVVRDAGSCVAYQRQMAESIGMDAAVVYYHPQAVLAGSPWLAGYPLIRTYHSVDPAAVPRLDGDRRRVAISGALGSAYPLRNRLTTDARRLGIDVLAHPGRDPGPAHTPAYLERLSGYKVHVATASRFGFALRKIVESVVAGCVPVTDLPVWDVLPVIDPWLVRIQAHAGDDEIQAAIDLAAAGWSLETARERSLAAVEFYGFRAVGTMLSAAIFEAARVHRAA